MDREVSRTKNFATTAGDFILEQAHKALGERNEFRIALSGGNALIPIYTRLAAIGHDLPWELTRITFGDERGVPPGRSTEQLQNGVGDSSRACRSSREINPAFAR
jgi:6-phosphogluconolactonase/glucosamine-6-phosphate isomerase/deaminase